MPSNIANFSSCHGHYNILFHFTKSLLVSVWLSSLPFKRKNPNIAKAGTYSVEIIYHEHLQTNDGSSGARKSKHMYNSSYKNKVKENL